MKLINIPSEFVVPCVPFFLSVEEWAARYLPPDEYFFAWQVPRSVICGRHQEIPLEVDLDAATALGIQVWRRKSGGGAVYADGNNIMFSYITPSTGVQTSFDSYTSKVCAMLASMGIDAAPTGRNDIAINGKKVAGNAFYAVGGRSIVHGTMLYDVDFATMGRVLTPSRAKVESKGVKSVPSRVTTLRGEGMKISCNEFIARSLAFLGDNGVITLSGADVARVREIMASYLTPEWLRIHSEKRSADVSRYIEGVGLVEFSRTVDARGIITDAKLRGDFFPLADIESAITNRLIGIPCTSNAIGAVLDSVNIPAVIAGLSRRNLEEILIPQQI